MSKKIITLSLAIIFISFLIMPLLTMAQTDSKFLNTCDPSMSLEDCQKLKLQEVSDKSYKSQAGEVSSATISEKVGTIISYILAFLGVIFLIIAVLAGIQWMTAGGNEEKVTKARTMLLNAVMGLIIVMAAYAITFFVVSKLRSAVNPPTTIEEPPTNGGNS